MKKKIPAPPKQPSSAGRQGRVFSIRLTEEERDKLERAAKKSAPEWRPWDHALGRFLKDSALARANVVLGTTAWPRR